jgi:hypothetical protein
VKGIVEGIVEGIVKGIVEGIPMVGIHLGDYTLGS